MAFGKRDFSAEHPGMDSLRAMGKAMPVLNIQSLSVNVTCKPISAGCTSPMAFGKRTFCKEKVRRASRDGLAAGHGEDDA
jgi:hypothetical protein